MHLKGGDKQTGCIGFARLRSAIERYSSYSAELSREFKNYRENAALLILREPAIQEMCLLSAAIIPFRAPYFRGSYALKPSLSLTITVVGGILSPSAVESPSIPAIFTCGLRSWRRMEDQHG